MIDLSVDIRQLMDVKDVEKLYQLSAGQRGALNRKLGRLLIKQTKKRISQQRDIHGNGLKKRKSGKGKIYKKLGRGLTVFAGPNKARVTWKNGLTGSIAYQHHHGIPERWTAAKAKRLRGKPDYKGPATREQARSLKVLGFKIKAKKGRTKIPTLKWIMENMTNGVAGLEIKKLRGTPSKQSWLIPVSKRQVLGVEPIDVKMMADLITQTVNKKK